MEERPSRLVLELVLVNLIDDLGLPGADAVDGSVRAGDAALLRSWIRLGRSVASSAPLSAVERA